MDVEIGKEFTEQDTRQPIYVQGTTIIFLDRRGRERKMETTLIPEKSWQLKNNNSSAALILLVEFLAKIKDLKLTPDPTLKNLLRAIESRLKDLVYDFKKDNEITPWFDKVQRALETVQRVLVKTSEVIPEETTIPKKPGRIGGIVEIVRGAWRATLGLPEKDKR